MAKQWHVPVRSWLSAHVGDVLIGMAVLVAYWPLVTLHATLPLGDTMDCWLPWRWFVASSIQDGALPWWNSLQQMGYPVHADLQGPAWYVEAIALAGTVGHGPIVLQYLFLAYVMIGGWGMRRMVTHLGVGSSGSIMAGLCYALSGYFTGHAMHFYAVISAAWTPWAFAALLALLDRPGWRTALRTSLFLALMVTGGNHGSSILSAYPMTFLVLLAIWRIRDDRWRLFQLLGYGGGAILMTALMTAGTLHAVWEVKDQVTRLGGLSLEQAQVNPLTVRAMASLLQPATASLGAEVLGTDPTMANTYMGVIALVFSVLGAGVAFRGRTGILAGVGVLAALAALGPVTPVHRWCWAYLPGMDLFRFPGYFWFLTMIGLLPLAAWGWQRMEGIGARRIAMGLFVLLGSGMMLQGMTTPFGRDPMTRLLFSGSIPYAPVLDGGLPMVLGGALVLAMAVVLALVDLRGDRMLILVALEGMVAVHTSRASTALHAMDPRVLIARLAEYPPGPVVPELVAMGANKDGQGPVQPLWRNTRVFQGGPSHDGFNSFWLAHHQRLTAEWPRLHATMLERPLMSLSTHVKAMGTIPDGRIDLIADKDLVLVHPATIGERALGPCAARVELLNGDHHGWTLRTRSTAETFLLVQQSRYPGWCITVDGDDRPVIPANLAAFGTWVPAGEHLVEVVYARPFLTGLFALSQGTWFLALFALSMTSDRRLVHLTFSGVLFGAWCWSVFGQVPKAERLVTEWSHVTDRVVNWSNVRTVVNTDRPVNGLGPDQRNIRIDAPDRVNALAGAVGETLPDSLIVAWHGVPMTTSMRAWLAGTYGPPQVCWEGEHAGVWALVRPPRSPGSDTLHRSSGSSALHSGSPFTPAFRFVPDTLSRIRGSELVINAGFRSDGPFQCRMVIEQRSGEEVLTYEAVPLEPPAPGLTWNSSTVVRPLAGTVPGAEWGVYFWHSSGDTVQLRDWSVIVTDAME